VSLDLFPAPNTDLHFTRPPEDFANELFRAWFSDPSHDQHGGAFTFILPISISDLRVFGSLSLRLRNDVGWSLQHTIQGSACQ
jgi:hypothetical protein